MPIQKILEWRWPFLSIWPTIWPIEKILCALEILCPIIITAFHVIEKMLFVLLTFWLMPYNRRSKVSNVNYQITLLILKYEMNVFWFDRYIANISNFYLNLHFVFRKIYLDANEILLNNSGSWTKENPNIIPTIPPSWQNKSYSLNNCSFDISS